MRLLVFLLLLSPLTSHAWGPIGHRVVGAVANNHLTPKAKKGVAKLLGNLTLADSTTWADEIRSNPAYNSYRPWHYVSVPDGEKYQKTKGAENVIEAIKTMTQRLKSKKASTSEKTEALKFLAHFIGDLHQPLHVGRKTDRGGNDIKVTWFDKDLNLHQVWDSGIIDQEMLSYTEITQLIDYPHPEDLAWKESSLMTWANESMKLRPLVYEFSDRFIPEKEMAEIFKRKIPKTFKTKPRLSYQYFGRVKPIVRQRLYQAGIRLAKVLNEVFK